MRLSIRPWLIAALAIGGLVVIGWSLENHLLYFPTRAVASTPASYGLPFEDLSLTAEDGVRLRGWRIHGAGRGSESRALLFFHGNAGNVGDRLDRARILVQRLGLDVFLVDYRGYGASEGSPSEGGLYRDARAIHRAARERGFAPERIVVFGESLGAAVAVDLAGSEACAGLILETPFLSIAAMARAHYPFVPGFLVRSRFDNAAKISSIRAPKLFLVAERDAVAPADQGRRLYELAPPPKTLYVIPGAGHNDTYATGGEAYWREWEKFLGSAPRS